MVLHDMADAIRRFDAAPDRARIAEAILAPELQYASPSDVLLDYRLPRAEKIALLRNWKCDLEQRSQARDDGMADREEGLGRQIAAVSSALERLQPS